MSEQPPRKRPTPAVYRRRRLVVLLAIVVVAVVVWVLIAQPWRSAAAQVSAPKPDAGASASPVIPSDTGATPTATPEASEGPSISDEPAPEPAPSAEPTAEPTPETTVGAPVVATPCIASDVQVKPVADAETYAAGQNPQFSISLTNRSGKDCTMNVGTSTQTFTVMSGSDIWWRSTDCQSEPSDMVVLLAAGQTVTSAAPLTWDRTRSAVGSCDATDRQKAPGGGASYHLSVAIGGISSTQSTQILLY
ncbi:hypothetical protein ACFM35_15670 [Microbacterium sp. P01]|uniref:hypothetical protein n=1 Tax=unclassified Microbacterium TaxID=2609290 RepID=UPI00366FB7FC